MASLRLLLYGGLIFITAIAFPVDKDTTKSSIVFDYNVVPMHYDIKLIIYFKEEDRVYFKDEERGYFKEMEEDDIYRKFKTNIEKHQAKGRFIFYGEINVTIDIFHPTTRISLNSSSSIYYLSGELIENNANNVKHPVEIFSYNDKAQICNLYFEVDEVPRGNYTLNIKFLNAINTAEDDTIFLKTTYIKKLKSKTWSDATDFQIEAQRFFPYWDKPTIRTTFNISIKHHRNFKAFSNMPIRQEEIITYFQQLHTVETYFQWTHFDTTPAMNAHLVMVMLTPLFRSSGPNRCQKRDAHRIHMWRIPYCAKHIKFAQEIANKVMMKLKFEWFKKLEIPELQLVTIPDLQNDTNMNFGLVTIRETNIIYDENVHSVAQKIEVARLIARGVAYQWFGNLINLPWSSYLWLNDGLTTLFGMDALDAVNALGNYENSGMLDLFIVQQYESLNSYGLFFTELPSEASSPSEIDLFSSFFRYVKAPLILRTLQHLVTKEVFWRGIRRYLHMHALNLTTSDDFWTVMQATVDESCPEHVSCKFSLEMLITGWTYYAHYPVLRITRNYNAITIIIQNYKAFKNYPFSIPITFTTENNLNFMNLASPFHDDRLRLTLAYKLFYQIDVINDGWIMFNIQQTGHYRVDYDVENWRKITDYLNSGKYKKIHVLNRAKIIDDAFYFMMEGKKELDSSIFWNLTSYLAQETNYVAWYPMIKALEYISGFFPFSDEKIEYIKKKLNTLGSLLSKIKYEETFEEEEFTKCLRQEAIKWACILGNSDCQKWAKITLQRKLLTHIEKLETDKFLSWWDEWIYCKGLMLADSRTWHTMKNIKTLVHNNDNRFLEFLACSQNNIDEYLTLITPEDNGTYMGIQANKSVNSFLFIIAKQARNNSVLRNILINFSKLKPRDVSTMAAFAIIINHVYSKDQLNEIRNFTKDIIENEVFIEHALQKHTHEINVKPNYEERKDKFRKYKSEVEKWTFEVENKLKKRLDEIDKCIDYFHTYLT